LLKTGGIALAVGFALVMRRRVRTRTRAWQYLLRAEAAVLATVVGLAVVLTGLPTPARATTQLGPGLAHLRLGYEGATVSVVGSGDQGLLTYVASDANASVVRVVNRVDGAEWLPGPGPTSHPIALRDGVAQLRVLWAAQRIDLTVAAGRAPTADDSLLADAAALSSYALGAAVAHWAGARPAAGVSCVRTPDATALGAAFGEVFRRLDIRAVDVYVDGSPRAAALITGLRRTGVTVTTHLASAATKPTRSPTAAIVATDVVTAQQLIPRFATAAPARGVYLAPWLAESSVLSLTQKIALPLLAVGSSIDLGDSVAERYRIALAAAAARAEPSAAGLLGFLSVVDPAATEASQFRLFAAAPIAFLPSVINAGHDHGTDSTSRAAWFPNGSLTAITPASPVTTHCISP
jgi:hypothetical protein